MADEVLTFDMCQLKDGLRMGRVTSWTQFRDLWNTVMSVVRFAMVHKSRTPEERNKLVSLLKELQIRMTRMEILSSSSGDKLPWEAKKLIIFQVNEWHEHGRFSQEQFRKVLKDLQMWGSIRSMHDGSGGFAGVYSSDDDVAFAGSGGKRRIRGTLPVVVKVAVNSVTVSSVAPLNTCSEPAADEPSSVYSVCRWLRALLALCHFLCDAACVPAGGLGVFAPAIK
jgi:hypothetical protein